MFTRPAEIPKPAWFSAGLFSGDGALALPGADLVDHKERQGDDSFLVFVVSMSNLSCTQPLRSPLLYLVL